MSLAELILAIIIIIVFCLGIWGGLRLFRWNMRDREELEVYPPTQLAHALPAVQLPSEYRGSDFALSEVRVPKEEGKRR